MKVHLQIKKCSIYLGVILDKKLTHRKQLNQFINKKTLAIRPIHLVRHQITLKARKNLFSCFTCFALSLVLSQLEFSATFFQIRWDIKICYFPNKHDTAQSLPFGKKTLPAEFHIEKNLIKSISRYYPTSKHI